VGRQLPLPTAVTHSWGARTPLLAYSDYAASGIRPLKFSKLDNTTWDPAAVAVAGPFDSQGGSTGPWPLLWKKALLAPGLAKQSVFFQEDDGDKSAIARALIEAHPVTSVQAINETVSVLTRKYGFTLAEAHEVAESLLELCEVVPVDAATVREAIRLARRYSLSHWDSLIVAAALLAGCDILYSEDLQHGQVFDGGLTIVNPFLSIHHRPEKPGSSGKPLNTSSSIPASGTPRPRSWARPISLPKPGAACLNSGSD